MKLAFEILKYIALALEFQFCLTCITKKKYKQIKMASAGRFMRQSQKFSKQFGQSLVIILCLYNLEILFFCFSILQFRLE